MYTSTTHEPDVIMLVNVYEMNHLLRKLIYTLFEVDISNDESDAYEALHEELMDLSFEYVDRVLESIGLAFPNHHRQTNPERSSKIRNRYAPSVYRDISTNECLVKNDSEYIKNELTRLVLKNVENIILYLEEKLLGIAFEQIEPDEDPRYNYFAQILSDWLNLNGPSDVKALLKSRTMVHEQSVKKATHRVNQKDPHRSDYIVVMNLRTFSDEHIGFVNDFSIEQHPTY